MFNSPTAPADTPTATNTPTIAPTAPQSSTSTPSVHATSTNTPVPPTDTPTATPVPTSTETPPPSPTATQTLPVVPTPTYCPTVNPLLLTVTASPSVTRTPGTTAQPHDRTASHHSLQRASRLRPHSRRTPGATDRDARDTPHRRPRNRLTRRNQRPRRSRPSPRLRPLRPTCLNPHRCRRRHHSQLDQPPVDPPAPAMEPSADQVVAAGLADGSHALSQVEGCPTRRHLRTHRSPRQTRPFRPRTRRRQRRRPRQILPQIGTTKTVDQPIATVGDTLTYTIIVTNPGTPPLVDVEVAANLPPGLAIVSVGGGGGYNPVTSVSDLGRSRSGTWRISGTDLHRDPRPGRVLDERGL